MQNKISTSQLRVWLLAAVVPAILSIAGRNGWLTALIMAIGCGALCFCVLSCQIERFPKWLCVLEVIWLTVFLGGIAKIGGSCWSEANAYPWIPIILLMLAAYASQKGVFQSARMGATLLWLVIPVLALVFLTGTMDIRLEWIPTELEFPDGALVALLLVPCITTFFPRERKTLRWLGLILGVVAVAASVLIYGTMGGGNSKNRRKQFL